LILASQISLDSSSDSPIYRQLADSVRVLIERGAIKPGERLPATRELAAQLGLNRATVSAAYALLEQSGLLQGHVGRGSFVAAPELEARTAFDWESILPLLEHEPQTSDQALISFAASRPSREAFPLAQFRRLAKEVVDSEEAVDILQLGSAYGYAPLRRYLLSQAVKSGIARSSDDLIITNGCQQGLDLLARLFAGSDCRVLMEDPVYHGLPRVFQRAGATVIPAPVDAYGIDVDVLPALIEQYRPRVLVVNPNFQNPTGATLPLEQRKRIVELAQRFRLILIEDDVYGELRYVGRDLPPLKELDESGNTILLRSYSKASFPGLRVGWVLAPRPVVTRLAEAKQISDLHSDQLSQAVLLRFAESGELERHLERTRAAGCERLQTLAAACARHLPPGTGFVKPEGGMNLWLELPAPLTAQALLPRAEERGVTFLPGNFFSCGRPHPRGIRISFGGLPPQQIAQGIRLLGEAAHAALDACAPELNWEPAAALV
jgi:2-aminoadipate transaminase